MSLYKLRTLAVIPALFLISCESKELTRKREQQNIEITRLKGELTLIEQKLNNLPPDRSAEVASAEIEAESQKEELKELEADVAELEVKKREIEQQFTDYKRKYAIR